MGIGEVVAGAGRPGRAVFLDRDGVINATIPRTTRKGPGNGPPWSLAELAISPDAHASFSRLAAAGFRLIVVTNQPDIARGDLGRGTLAEINRAIWRALPMLDRRFLVCMHDDQDDCFCRKPKPGMLVAAASQYGLDLASCYLIGDRYKDVEAAHNAGCRAVWLRAIRHEERLPARAAEYEAATLTEAADWIVSQG